MKFHRRRIRLLKGLALAGCTLGLAVPSVAGAMPVDGPITRPHQAQPPASYTLPSGFQTDAQSQGSFSRTPHYVLPSSHKVDVPSPNSTATPSPVVREVQTHEGSRTLAIVLAACALGVALFGTAYAIARVTLVQRKQLGSS